MDEDTQRIEGLIYRNFALTREAILDEEERIVQLSFSSELPVLRASFFEMPWLETLGHKKTEADFSRLNDGATLHYNHRRTREDRLGGVLEAKLKDRRGTATVQFSKNSRVDDVWDDVRAGILRNVSVGYEINERKLVREGKSGEPDEYRVTKWTPREISFVDIPADPTVGLGRSVEGAEDVHFPGMPERGQFYRVIDVTQKENRAMGDENRDTQTPGQTTEGDNARSETPSVVVDLDKARDDARAEGEAAGREEGIRAEHQRQADIREAFRPFAKRLGEGYQEMLDGFLGDPTKSRSDARDAILVKLGADTAPTNGSDSVRIEGVHDTSAFQRAAGDAIMLRAAADLGLTPEAQRELNTDLRGYTLFEMARRSLELGGVSTQRMTKMELVGRAFTTSDFPLILADIANKSMLKGFDEAPETWNVWCQTGNLSDFKVNSRVNLSSFDNLERVREHGEFKYGRYTEQGEDIQLGTYGKLFSISRQAIINDDVQAFTRIPSGMGRSASRLVGDLAYGVLTGNPVMKDGFALFNEANHNNDITTGGGAPSVEQVTKMRVRMGLQSDQSNSARGLNIRPAYLICPLALEDTSRVLQASETDPAQQNSRVPNAVRGLYETVADPRLDADSAEKWYMSASQQFDTVEVAFLDGQVAPSLEQQQGWHIDGTEFKVRQDVASAPMEYRTWQRNSGTA